MSHPSASTARSVSPAQVWASLAADLQGRVIWLLAQLAFNFLTAHAERSMDQEVPYALSSHPPQNPA
jgi:hypothetical protein